MPCRISQPAISEQISLLEAYYGALLFERRPFKLTEKGARLYAHVRRFFDGLPELERELRYGLVERLCLVVDDLIGVGFLSTMAAEIARRYPSLILDIRAGSPAKVEAALAGGEADVVITASDRTMPGMRSALLARVKPTLLVSQKTGIEAPGHFWGQLPISERLIYPVETGLLHHTFERGLGGLHVKWQPSSWVNSQAIMREIVAGGQGVGVGLALPEAPLNPRIRAIPLNHFDSIPVTVCWKTRTKPVVAATAEIICEIARRQWTAEPGKIVKQSGNVVSHLPLAKVGDARPAAFKASWRAAKSTASDQ
jgi:DNA-binding transcriptional LysR family regulator